MSEKFCLKWNDFENNVSKTFSQLRGESELFDVTLVGQDQKKVSAHRLVLSACSNFFKNIFYDNNSHSQPLLYLDEVDSEDINKMLDYMYKGEVKIMQDHLDRFLHISNKFQLEGLLGGEEGNAGSNDYVQKNEEEEEGDLYQEGSFRYTVICNFKQHNSCRPALCIKWHHNQTAETILGFVTDDGGIFIFYVV